MQLAAAVPDVAMNSSRQFASGPRLRLEQEPAKRPGRATGCPSGAVTLALTIAPRRTTTLTSHDSMPGLMSHDLNAWA